MSPEPDSHISIINTSDNTFELDVYDRSLGGLVVVDFWAEWCAPCRMLAPVLEKLADEYGGRFTLVKANTDDNQAAAGNLGVSGIPAVYGVLDGEVIDGFQGALPEAAIREWLDKLLHRASVSEADRLAETSPDAAEAKLRELLQESPNEWSVMISLAELLLNQGRDEECAKIVDQLDQRGFLEPAAAILKARLELKGKATIDVVSARAAAIAAPDDFSLQLELANALAGHVQYEECCEICLDLVRRDRKVTGEKARELMIEVFRVLGNDSEITSAYRRQLSAALY